MRLWDSVMHIHFHFQCSNKPPSKTSPGPFRHWDLDRTRLRGIRQTVLSATLQDPKISRCSWCVGLLNTYPERDRLRKHERGGFPPYHGAVLD